LKLVLKSIGQKVSGKKDDLVERIEEYLEKNDLVGEKKKKKKVKKEEEEMDLDDDDDEEEERPVQAKKRRKKSASYESE